MTFNSIPNWGFIDYVLALISLGNIGEGIFVFFHNPIFAGWGLLGVGMGLFGLSIAFCRTEALPTRET